MAQAELETLLPQAGSVTLAGTTATQGGGGNTPDGGSDASQDGTDAPPENDFPHGKMDNLTRACLIPVFLVIGQVEGMEATSLGIFDGFKAGLEDDYQLLKMLGDGACFVGGLIQEQWAAEVKMCQADRKKRAEAFKAVAKLICVEFVFKPLQELNAELSTWEGFKRQAFRLYELHNKIIDFHLQAFVAAKDHYPEISDKLANGITSWMDDFGDRMLQGSEKTVFANAPWHKDPLVDDLIGTGRHYAYGTGYAVGFVVEQVLSGIVQGGVGKIATVMLKGGLRGGTTVVKRSAFAISHQMHAVKQYLAGVWARSEMGFVQVSIGNAAKQPVSTALRTTAGDQVEKHLAKSFISRNSWNTKAIRDLVYQSTNLKRLALERGEEIIMQRLALLTHLMGDLADETLLRNFLKVMDQKLIYDVGGQPVDWADDFMRAFRGSPPSFVKRAPLDSFSDSAKQRLREFLTEPFPGYAWKFEEDITDNWKEPIVRGILVELDQFYKGGLKAAGWEHLPQREAVDFLDPSGVTAKQVKSLGTVNSATLEKMQVALTAC